MAFIDLSLGVFDRQRFVVHTRLSVHGVGTDVLSAAIVCVQVATGVRQSTDGELTSKSSIVVDGLAKLQRVLR